MTLAQGCSGGQLYATINREPATSGKGKVTAMIFADVRNLRTNRQLIHLQTIITPA